MRIWIILVLIGIFFLGTQYAYAQTIDNVSSGGFDASGIAINPTTNKIYIVNADIGDNSVTIIDGSTDTVIVTIAVGSHPRQAAANPITNKIYVTNFNSDTVSVISGSTNAVIATINVGMSPYGVGVNTATNKIYVTNFSDGTVTVIDGSNDMVTGSPITIGGGPYGVGVNSVTNTIYVAKRSSNVLSVISGSSDTEIQTLGVGTTPVAVAVNTITNRIYVANFDDDTISVINGDTNTNLPSISIPSGVGNVNAGPTDVAVDSGNNRILVSVRATGLTVVDGAVSVPLLEVALNGGEGVGVNESSNKVYVSSTMGSSSNISILSNFPFCTPPGSGNFVILSSCILEGNSPVPENVMVQNDSVLTIKNGMTLDINFASFNLTVKSGSGVLIEAGGKIT